MGSTRGTVEEWPDRVDSDVEKRILGTMSTKAQVQRQAFDLPPEDRIELVVEIWDSLERRIFPSPLGKGNCSRNALRRLTAWTPRIARRPGARSARESFLTRYDPACSAHVGRRTGSPARGELVPSRSATHARVLRGGSRPVFSADHGTAADVPGGRGDSSPRVGAKVSVLGVLPATP